MRGKGASEKQREAFDRRRAERADAWIEKKSKEVRTGVYYFERRSLSSSGLFGSDDFLPLDS